MPKIQSLNVIVRIAPNHVFAGLDMDGMPYRVSFSRGSHGIFSPKYQFTS